MPEEPHILAGSTATAVAVGREQASDHEAAGRVRLEEAGLPFVALKAYNQQSIGTGTHVDILFERKSTSRQWTGSLKAGTSARASTAVRASSARTTFICSINEGNRSVGQIL